MIKIFDGKNVPKGARIILYGAAMYGQLALNALEELGFESIVFCDRVQAGSAFCGLPVLEPADIANEKDAYILICATKGFQAIVSYLQEISVDNFYEISELLRFVAYDRLPEYCRRISVEEMIQKYKFYVEEEKPETTSLDLSFLALSITERCSLKCKKCSVLAPYYKKPCDDSLETVLEPLKRLLWCVDSVAEMQVGGGEPLMHKNLAEILEWAVGQEKIKEISIFTNSTIFPNESLTRVLKSGKIKLLLDDYGSLSRRLQDIIALCDKEKIRYIIQKFERWDDLGDFRNQNDSEEQVEKRFKYCSFGNVMSFMKGKLYRCTTAARIADLGIVEEKPEDFVDFRDGIYDRNEKRREINDLLYHKKYHNGCKYCRGISPSELGIPVAEQL